MKQPRPRGTDIDPNRLNDWLDDFTGYRHQVSESRIARWLGQFDDGSLGDGIGDRGSRGPEPRDRGDVDDPAAAATLHDRPHGLGQQHRGR